MKRTGVPGEEVESRESERRRTILRAAIDVFAQKGYHGCRIADVAREAGVAYGLVYHYFKNKDELLQTVFEASWTGFVQRVREVSEGEGDLEAKVRGIARIAFEAYRIDPRAVRVLILEIARSPVGQVNRQHVFGDVIRLAGAMFTRAQAQGELRGGADPLLCGALLFGSIEMGLTTFVVGLLDASDEAALEQAQVQIADSFLRGVLSDGAEKERTWAEKKERNQGSASRSRTASRT